MQLKDWFCIQTVMGQPMIIGDISMTPQSQSIIIQLPIGGFVWHRPVSVLLERDRQKQRLPIRDTTRILQLSLLGICLLFLIVSLMKFMHRKDLDHDR